MTRARPRSSEDPKRTTEIPAYLDLMAAVMEQMLNDFRSHLMVNIPLTKFEQKMSDSQEEHLRSNLSNGEESRLYFFDDSKYSTEYIFGFRHICSVLSLDYKSIRNKLASELICNDPRNSDRITNLLRRDNAKASAGEGRAKNRA